MPKLNSLLVWFFYSCSYLLIFTFFWTPRWTIIPTVSVLLLSYGTIQSTASARHNLGTRTRLLIRDGSHFALRIVPSLRALGRMLNRNKGGNRTIIDYQRERTLWITKYISSVARVLLCIRSSLSPVCESGARQRLGSLAHSYTRCARCLRCSRRMVAR